MARWTWFIVAIMGLTAQGWAAGGACPLGANYLNPANPAGAKVTLSTLGVTSCYYVAASGVDTNNGTSESTPWLHAPGMSTCTSTCNSANIPAGTGIIFRGGDTWHFGNGGATPYTGGTWTWTHNGNSSNPVYVGVDPTWYSGSSWARPILTGDNATSGSAVGSCTYTTGSGNEFVYLSGASYLHFDNFELTGFCWNNNTSTNSYIGMLPPNGGFNPPWYLEDLYIHGWTHTAYSANCASSSSPCPVGATVFNGPGNQFGVVIQFNVVDGSGSDDTGVSIVGAGAGDGYIVQYNVFRHFGGGNVPNDTHILHDNLFEYVNDQAGYDNQHTNVWLSYGEANDANHTADGTPNLFYNNIFRDIAVETQQPLSSVLWLLPARTGANADMVFNNVFHDNYATGNYNNFCNSGGGCGDMKLWNNTEQAPLPNTSGCIICVQDTSGSVITSVNNHWITNSGSTPSAVFSSTGMVTETASVYQTLSTANGQGYVTANDFAPTAASNGTVTASGTNETTALCAGLNNALAQAYCESGTTAGCSYNASTHSVSCPKAAIVPRPTTGAWNAGAYQLGSGAPVPPSDVTSKAN